MNATYSPISLVITDVNLSTRAYIGGAVRHIEEYIERNKPRVYQLGRRKQDLLIQQGELFSSSDGRKSGTLSQELGDILLQDVEEGRKIVATGGYYDACLKRTLDDLTDLGIDYKIFFDGTYDARPITRLFRKYIKHGRYVFN